MGRLKFFGQPPGYLESAGGNGQLIVVEGTDGVGRSTHVSELRRWLEVQGHAVVETGWTRSQLVGKAIDQAKAGHELSPLTYTLLYACDFADRLEGEILPALRAGYVVIADRYIHTAFARTTVRGVDPEWVRKIFSFAPVPDLVLYLGVDASTLARRVILAGGMDYWEAGKDRHPEMDIYDSFVTYQRALLLEFENLAREFRFITVDATSTAEHVQQTLREALAKHLSIAQPVDVPMTAAPKDQALSTRGPKR